MSLSQERRLFEHCVELPAAERAAWLEANCPDPALRERIVRLLAAHAAVESGRGFPKAVEPGAFLKRDIGPYRVLERIGEGAMGEVYLAEQTSPVVRRVAIKVIKPGLDTREVIARFEAERQTLAIMSHPSIAQIFDAGATEDGRPYFVMEHVAGPPLTDYCNAAKLGLRARIGLFLEICDGVQHAHHKGVIHRDLKPNNLLVTERDGKPVPKIIDFGIAKVTAPGQPANAAYTRFGNLVGTPEYMSPEQAQASPLDIDTRSDVYSLGVVLYELLVGALPYRLTGDTATPVQTLREILDSDVRAPSRVLRRDPARAAEAAANAGTSPRQLVAALGGDLDWITLKALEKDRRRRYASVAELAADLRRHLAREAVLAGPPSSLYRMRKFVARHRVAVAALVALFGATAAFGTMMALLAQELARERDEARFQAARAEASNEFMSVMLEQVGPSGEPLSMSELLDAGVALLERQYQGDPRFVAHMLLQISRRYMDLQDNARQRAVLERAEIIARSAGDDELLARTLCVMVQSLADQGEGEAARSHLDAAKRAAAGIARPSLELQVDCLRAEADLLRVAGTDRLAGKDVLERARRLLEDAGQTRGLAYTATLTDLGAMHYRAGRIREALEYALLTRDAFERNGRGGTLGMAVTISNIGQVYYRLGEVQEAERYGREAVERMRTLSDTGSPTPGTSVAYAIPLIRLGRAAEAEPLIVQARRDAIAAGNAFWIAQSSYMLGRAHLALGRYPEAAAELDAAGEHWRQEPDAHVDRLLELDRCRAELALELGRGEEARALIADVLSRMGFPERRDAPVLAVALRTAARIELEAGSAERAEELAAAALAIDAAVARDVAQSADAGESLLLLGLAQRARARLAEARDSLTRAEAALGNALGRGHALTLAARDALGALPAGA
jgi:non-specific serine/threonine protein kinase/serine/threonine-protein kinase